MKALPHAFSHWMQNRLGDEFQAFWDAHNDPPPVSIRNHPSKKYQSEADNRPVPWHPDGFYLPERKVFTLDPIFHAGGYYVQEASSMFLRETLRQSVDLSRPLKVLDLCAAPGGKSTLLLSELNSESWLLANETIKGRIAPLSANLQKWGFANSGMSNHDPADFSDLTGFFDVVVVDAPCSGEGLFRKDEQAMENWMATSPQFCADRQERILKSAKELVAPGGMLIYSTCTYNRFENDGNVQDLLDGGGFELIQLDVPKDWNIWESKAGYHFFPHRVEGEGFFITCLRRTDSPRWNINIKPAQLGKPVSNSQSNTLADWIGDAEEYFFLEKGNGEIIAVPRQHQSDFSTLKKVLYRSSFGIPIGTFKRDQFIPGHGLALSLILKKDFPGIELNEKEALLFLKKENLRLEGATKGWQLARYQGLNLGWMKVLDNRINNYLPNNWRIRMELPK